MFCEGFIYMAIKNCTAQFDSNICDSKTPKIRSRRVNKSNSGG